MGLCSMKWETYQREALKTAVYPTDMSITYPALGLVGEVGEVANKVKKVFRDDGGLLTVAKRAQLCDEVSDCFWYIAAVANDCGIIFDYGFDDLLVEVPSLDEATLLAAYHAGQIAYAAVKSMPQVWFKVELMAVAECLLAVCYHLGVSFLSILQANIDKLISRQERGTLGGDGDNR